MNVVGNPYNMVVLCTLIILVVLIVIPLMQMVKTTFTLEPFSSLASTIAYFTISPPKFTGSQRTSEGRW